jgi:hypothetical protein
MRVLASELERIWRDLEGIDHGRAE